MARKSVVERNEKRKKTIKMYKDVRTSLIRSIKDKSTSPEERFNFMLKINKLPRDSSYTRLKMRCAITGRPKGVYRKLGICRHKIRDLVALGNISGMRLSSW